MTRSRSPGKDQYWQRNTNAVSSRAEKQARKLHLLQMFHQRAPSIVLHQRHRLQDLQTAWPQERSSLLPLPIDSSSSSTVVKKPQTSGTQAPAPDSGDVEPDQGKSTAATTTTTTTTATLTPPATPLRPCSRRGRESTQSTLNLQGRSQSVPREKRPRSSHTQQPDSAKAARTACPSGITCFKILLSLCCEQSTLNNIFKLACGLHDSLPSLSFRLKFICDSYALQNEMK